ncbi:MAG: tetratricopeptide repeat protein [Blastocatellia bacterium]
MSRKNRIRKAQKDSIAGLGRGLSSVDVSRNWIIGLVLGMTFLAFSNTLTNDFAYDDQMQILQSDFIKDLRNVPKALVTETWFWRVQQDKDPSKEDKPSTPYYRPVFVIYLMLGWKFFGASAPGWHLLNVLLHVIVVYFVYAVLEKVTGDQRLAAIASVLFAVHPLRSESVAWISGVTDLLLAVFLVPSFFLYLRYRELGERKYLAGAFGLFLLAAFTKEPALSLPVFISAYEVLIADQERPLSHRLKKALLHGGSFMILGVAYFGVRRYVLGFFLNDLSFKSYSTGEVLLTIPLVICKYIGLLLWPVNLSLFHETMLVGSPLDLRFILPTLGLGAVGFGIWRVRKSIIARFAILWFAINLLPVLNLSAFALEFLVQERYVYIPSIGFSLLIAMALVRVPVERWFTLVNRRTARAVVVALVVLALTGKTLAQNTVWKDDMTLWTYGVEAAPDQPMSHYVLGHKYINQQNPEKAIGAFEAYLQLKPNNLIIVSNLAAAHLVTYQNQAAVNPGAADRSHLDRAAAVCEKGLSINDKQPTLWDTLGTVYTFDTGLRNYDRAVGCFNRALQLQPENGMVNFHLGATLAKQGNDEGALRYLETARKLQPELADVYKFLAYLYRSKGEFQLAIDNLSQYLRLKPDAFDAQRISKDVHDLRAKLENASPQS